MFTAGYSQEFLLKLKDDYSIQKLNVFVNSTIQVNFDTFHDCTYYYTLH